MKLSRAKAIYYGLGNLMGVGSGLIVQWLMYYYSPPKNAGLTPLAPIVVMGIVFLFGRAIDAVSDPLIGWWSDRTYTRWGRRKPFIVAGCILMALSQTLIWLPPVHTVSLINAVYAAIMLGIFWFGYTAAIAPYLALLPEIAEDDAERIRLTTYQALFLQVSVVITGLIVPLFLLRYLGFFLTSVVLTAIMFFAMTPLVLTIKERITPDKVAKKLGFFEAIKLTLKNRVFVTYLIMIFFLQLAINMMNLVLPYGVTVLGGLQKYYVGYFYIPLLIVSLITLPIYRSISVKWGKKKVFMMSMIGLSVASIVAFFIGIIPVNPLIMIIVIGGFVGVFIIPQFMMPNAFIAEISDLDESITGYRREAIYFGVQGLIWKSAAGVAALLSGFVMSKYGYNPGHDLGVRLVYIISSVLLVVAAAILTRYRVDKH